jgi:FAD/FMN-containing dehydrogenase/Fe-S oxidoreductase
MSLDPDFNAELRKRFSGDIRLDLTSRILYSTDASIYQIEPLGVVIPRTQDDLQAVVETAVKYHVPLVPRGAGTSLAGQAIGEGIIVDCSRWLDRILELDRDRHIARVEPGVILSKLNREAGQLEMQFGPDPASAERATIGGVVANNATGAHSIIYGMTADHLVSANVVLSDGSIAALGPLPDDGSTGSARSTADSVPPERDLGSHSRYNAIVAAARQIRSCHKQAIQERFPRTWRNSAGYRLNYLLPWAPTAPGAWNGSDYPAVPAGAPFNLAQLLAGSEGTLAVFRDVTLNLVPKPKHTILGILSFDDLAAACDAVAELLRKSPSAIELIPRLILDSARRIPGYASQMGWLRGDPTAILVVEFSGDDLSSLGQRVDQLGDDVQTAATPDEQAMVWGTRKAGLGLLDTAPQSARPTTFIEDCAIPVEHLGAFVREIQRIMDEHDARGGIYGHASAGCLHIRPVLDLKSGRGVRALREIAEQTLQLTLWLGGAMSSEHGDGMARGEWLRQTYGEELASAMLELKKAADPDGILNPGKMLEAPPMDSNLRYGQTYRSKAWASGIDFSARGGLNTAIEQCNGQGVCRQEAGAMCPSFQATREEMYSTRGRANLLRALISTHWEVPGNAKRPERGSNEGTRYSQPQMADAAYLALDLCLACKGCKAECPSGVDMARLKSAFLEYHYRTHLRPLRDYIFGYFAETARLLSAMGPMVNAAVRVPLLQQIGVRSLGITSNRPLPQFGSRRPRMAHRSESPSVLLIRDPFSHYVDSAVEDAALALLEAAGFNVRVLATVSSGAALISKGFLSAARHRARGLLDELSKLDPNGRLPVVMLEPSELSAVIEDYPNLLPDISEASAKRFTKVQSVEELLVRSRGFSELHAAAPRNRVLFHPHCHEKAGSREVDSSADEPYAGMQLLRLCGYDVELIDAGCCGMGGTFGYEAEHYELSQKIGALKLYPAIGAAGDALVAATGGACRLQITQGTAKRAEHPLVLAARALALTPTDSHT